MEPADIRSTLTTLPFIQALPEGMRNEMIDVILEITEPADIEKETELFTEGERGSDVGYFLLEGDVEVRKSVNFDIQVSAPELLGEMKQFNPVGLRTATVESLTPLQVLSFDWSDFRNATEDHFSPEDLAILEKALEDYAWQHFTG